MKYLIQSIINDIIQDFKDSWRDYCYSVRNFSEIESSRIAQNKVDMIWYLDPVRQNREAWEYWFANDYSNKLWMRNFNKPKGKPPEDLIAQYSIENEGGCSNRGNLV